jgi:hypothetical protein
MATSTRLPLAPWMKIHPSEQDADRAQPEHERRGYMSEVDNEAKFLFFPAGSVLVKAGEKNGGETSCCLVIQRTDCMCR